MAKVNGNEGLALASDARGNHECFVATLLLLYHVSQVGTHHSEGFSNMGAGIFGNDYSAFLVVAFRNLA